jgi:hypothetical protein
LEGVKKSIDKSNPLMGDIDPSGAHQFYLFHFDVDRKIEEYRKAGKNPHDLFDPSRPEYLGRPEAIAPYQKTINQSIQSRVNAITNPLPGTGSRVPGAAPTVQPRQPGESVQDYLKRTGKQ